MGNRPHPAAMLSGSHLFLIAPQRSGHGWWRCLLGVWARQCSVGGNVSQARITGSLRSHLLAPYGRTPSIRQRATRFACISGDGLAGSQFGLPTVASTGSLRSHPTDTAAVQRWRQRARRLALRAPYGCIYWLPTVASVAARLHWQRRARRLATGSLR